MRVDVSGEVSWTALIPSVILTSNSLRDPQRDIADISITIPGCAQAAMNAAASVLGRPDGGDPGETATTTEVLVVTGTGSVMNITGVVGEQKDVPIVTTRMNVGTRVVMTEDVEFTCVLDGALAAIDDETMGTLSTTLVAAGKGVGNVRVAALAMTEEEVMGALSAVLAAVEDGAGCGPSTPLATIDEEAMGALSTVLATMIGEEEEIDMLQPPRRRERHLPRTWLM